MTTWDLDIRRGWQLGLVFVVLLALLTASIVIIAVLNPLSLFTFLLGVAAFATLGAAGLVIYWLWGLVNAGYAMDRNRIVIRWGEYEHQIPMAEVRAVYLGKELDGVRYRRAMRWPGYCVGWGSAPTTGPLHFYATAPLDQQIIVVLENMAYAISPDDPETFLHAMEERLEMGATQDIVQENQHPAFFDWAIWRDRWALSLLEINGLLLVALLGVLCWRYPNLPAEIVLKRGAEGQPLLVTQSGRIFYLALLGTLFTLTDGGGGFFFYHRRRAASYLLWGGLLVLQTGLWIAALTVLLTV